MFKIKKRKKKENIKKRGGEIALQKLNSLVQSGSDITITIIALKIIDEIKKLAAAQDKIVILEKSFESSDLQGKNLVIDATGDTLLNEKIKKEASSLNILVHIADRPELSGFQLSTVVSKEGVKIAINANGQSAAVASRINYLLDHRLDNRTIKTDEKRWKKIATQLIIVFALVIIGHIIISYLPIPSFLAIWNAAKPFLDYNFLFFVLTGFLAQMVDGVLGMGYGVTSATCLITLGVNPVSVSAAIHTSEIFTTAASGYSHYKFGNVNKKLFRHLVIPGVIGAILEQFCWYFWERKQAIG